MRFRHQIEVQQHMNFITDQLCFIQTKALILFPVAQTIDKVNFVYK
jgi:hypothetical protein